MYISEFWLGLIIGSILTIIVLVIIAMRMNDK